MYMCIVGGPHGILSAVWRNALRSTIGIRGGSLRVGWGGEGVSMGRSEWAPRVYIPSPYHGTKKDIETAEGVLDRLETNNDYAGAKI